MGAGMASIGPSSVNKNRNQYLQEDRSLPRAYLKKVTDLRCRTLAVKAEDGGRLSPEHAATLQNELTHLQRQYPIRADCLINPG